MLPHEGDDGSVLISTHVERVAGKESHLSRYRPLRVVVSESQAVVQIVRQVRSTYVALLGHALVCHNLPHDHDNKHQHHRENQLTQRPAQIPVPQDHILLQQGSELRTEAHLLTLE
jgi:hypothetical protein